jgi:hypothetical protein
MGRAFASRRNEALAVVALLALPSPAAGQDVTGQATVIDGDTIKIHSQRIRLWGIDAPESAQLCRGSEQNRFLGRTGFRAGRFERVGAPCPVAMATNALCGQSGCWPLSIGTSTEWSLLNLRAGPFWLPRRRREM